MKLGIKRVVIALTFVSTSMCLSMHSSIEYYLQNISQAVAHLAQRIQQSTIQLPPPATIKTRANEPVKSPITFPPLTTQPSEVKLFLAFEKSPTIQNLTQIVDWLDSIDLNSLTFDQKKQLISALQQAISKVDQNKLKAGQLEIALQHLGGIRKEQLPILQNQINKNIKKAIQSVKYSMVQAVLNDIIKYELSGGSENYSDSKKLLENQLELINLGTQIGRSLRVATQNQPNLSEEDLRKTITEALARPYNVGEISSHLSMQDYQLRKQKNNKRDQATTTVSFWQLNKEDKRVVVAVSVDLLKDVGGGLPRNLISSLEQFVNVPTAPQKIPVEVKVNSKDQVAALNNIIQVKVANQMSPNGGGAASCGYHAVKNAVFLVRAVFNDAQAIPAYLTDQQILNYYFSPAKSADDFTGAGIWRKIIIDANNEKALFWYVKTEILQQFLKSENDISSQLPFPSILSKGRIRSTLMSVLASYAQQLVLEKLPELAEPSKQLKISLNYNTLVMWIKNNLKVDEDIPALNVRDFIINNLNSFINNKNIVVSLGKNLARDAYNKQPGGARLLGTGEWISDADIQRLIGMLYAKNDLLAAYPIVPFQVIGAMDQLDRDSIELGNIQEILQQFKKENTFVCAFILGTMESPDPKYNSEYSAFGHWFSLVVNKYAPGQVQYLIADSLENHNDLKSHSVQIIVNLFNEALRGKSVQYKPF